MLFFNSSKLFQRLLNCQCKSPLNGYIPSRYDHRKALYKYNQKENIKKLRFFVVDRYLLYLKDYDKILAMRFPDALGLYRVFVDGTKDFLRDVRVYYNIIRILNTEGKSFTNLTRKEIELYNQMPKDMKKLLPILILSTLPFATYLLIPLMYLFPKQILSKHFWNLQQRVEFNRSILQGRLVHNRPIFRYVQGQLDTMKNRDNPLYQPWSNVLGLIGSGVQPTVNEILECKQLFENEPYHLLYLSGNHVKHLLYLHHLHTGLWFRRRRLANRAFILKEMDKAILREGGIHNLPIEALKMCCFIRGLDPTNMKNEDMINWLTKWVTISKQVDKHSASLLLHCPILLGYNEPSNWSLIYADRK